MELTRYFSPEQVLLGLEVKDKWELLDKMVDSVLQGKICSRQDADVKNAIRQEVMNREKTTPTGFGGGFAFPHARVRGFNGFAFCIAVLKQPIDYNAMDNKPVQIACMAITPENSPAIGLKAMGTVAVLLGDEAVRNVFLSAADPQKVFDLIDSKGLRLDSSITAETIMREPYMLKIQRHTPLRQVAHQMFKHNVDACCVLDDEEHVVGEITCNALFKKGVPDFFSQLASVAFIRDFDPFEAYFEHEAHSTAGDVMSEDFASLDVSATMMEIIFLLAVKNYSKIYVTRNGRRAGIIDRIAVLEKVLNL
ncbi:MAG TPA: PTS sugar transporter subunit IIA, partial [Phycisphaerae bacterium]|nr:PTS sugar transporter subunit IIA [Phycisphaerae bacterium]HPS53392.1 PTS sugar transporter subunit IIA [Phycisphaerae bacterium]